MNPCGSPCSTTKCPCGNLCSTTVGDGGNLCSTTTLSRGDSCLATSLVLASPYSATVCPCGSPCSNTMRCRWKPPFELCIFVRIPLVDCIVDARESLLDRVVLVREPLLNRVLFLAVKRETCVQKNSTNSAERAIDRSVYRLRRGFTIDCNAGPIT